MNHFYFNRKRCITKLSAGVDTSFQRVFLNEQNERESNFQYKLRIFVGLLGFFLMKNSVTS